MTAYVYAWMHLAVSRLLQVLKHAGAAMLAPQHSLLLFVHEALLVMPDRQRQLHRSAQWRRATGEERSSSCLLGDAALQRKTASHAVHWV